MIELSCFIEECKLTGINSSQYQLEDLMVELAFPNNKKNKRLTFSVSLLRYSYEKIISKSSLLVGSASRT